LRISISLIQSLVPPRRTTKAMNIAPRYLVLEAFSKLARACECNACCIEQLLPSLRLQAEALQTAESLCAGLKLTNDDIARVLNESSGEPMGSILQRLESIQQSLSNKLFVLRNFAQRLCEDLEQKSSPECCELQTALLFARSGLNVVELLNYAEDSSQSYDNASTTP
jgi:hypothetical protein